MIPTNSHGFFFSPPFFQLCQVGGLHKSIEPNLASGQAGK